jgi:hypothetical protein
MEDVCRHTALVRVIRVEVEDLGQKLGLGLGLDSSNAVTSTVTTGKTGKTDAQTGSLQTSPEADCTPSVLWVSVEQQEEEKGQHVGELRLEAACGSVVAAAGAAHASGACVQCVWADGLELTPNGDVDVVSRALWVQQPLGDQR